MSERITGIINRLTEATVFDDASWLLGRPVENIALSIVDDEIKTNMEFQGEAGLPARIVRTVTPVGEKWPCDFCMARDGTFEYPDVPPEIWQRHEGCRCIIEYEPAGRRERQTLKVSTEGKKPWEVQSMEVLEERKRISGIEITPAKEIVAMRKMFGLEEKAS